jgi:hypothetical protein
MRRILIAAALFAAATPLSYGQSMDHSAHAKHSGSPALPDEGGQSAFAAIQEIVALLSADPDTDWSKVDIDTLRDHLVDMDELTRNAVADASKTADGLTIRVTGSGRTLRAIRNMVPAHTRELDKIAGWSATAELAEDGATMTVTSSDPSETAKIQALGFFGLMATGAHHQAHHWAMATGGPVHRH